MEIKETKKHKKNIEKYVCETCDFRCYIKGDWDRHIVRPKHINRVNWKSVETKKLKKTYICDCGKNFITNSGLWKHKKVCNQNNCEIYSNNEPTDKELIMMLLKQNTQLIEQNAELTKNGINNTTNSHNTNSLNKTFNLQFFLNETCKDAMNIMDFVDSIKLQLTDLEKVGQIGYVEGISNIITTNLKALDVTQRPIHCTDKKRETLYIKDEDKWEKDNEENNKIKKVIKKVANKNIMLLQKFKEAHPDCGKSASKYSDQYNKIIIESMGGSGDNDLDKEDKIIRNITKIVTIDKVLETEEK
jgi:hypothetical protein